MDINLTNIYFMDKSQCVSTRSVTVVDLSKRAIPGIFNYFNNLKVVCTPLLSDGEDCVKYHEATDLIQM